MTEWLFNVREQHSEGFQMWKDAHAQQLSTDLCSLSTLTDCHVPEFGGAPMRRDVSKAAP